MLGHGLLEAGQHQGLLVAGVAAPVGVEIERAAVGGEIVRAVARCRPGIGQLARGLRDSQCHLGRDLVLDREQVGRAQIAVIGGAPDGGAVRHGMQAHVDAHLLGGRGHAALEQVAGAQGLRLLQRIAGRGRPARPDAAEHLQLAETGQSRDDLIGQPLHQPPVDRRHPAIGERHHQHGRPKQAGSGLPRRRRRPGSAPRCHREERQQQHSTGGAEQRRAPPSWP